MTDKSISDRVKALYAMLRSETDEEPEFAFHQLAVMNPAPRVIRNCNNCDSHFYNLCPIHPNRTYKHSEENDCPDWQERRS